MSRLVPLAILTLHLQAIFFFGCWLARTDWLFGHFQGPPGFVIAAWAAAAVGLASSSVWFGLYLFRRQKVIPEVSSPGSTQWLGTLLRVGHILVVFPSLLILVEGSAILPKALEKLRRERLESRFHTKDASEVIPLLKDPDL